MSGWESDYTPVSEGRGDNWKAAEHVGEVTLFLQPRPEEMETQFGDTIAAVCSAIIPMSGPEKGNSFTSDNGVAVFGNLGRNLLDMKGTSFVLGVVSQGKAKPGRSAPFILDDLDGRQKSAAFKWMDANLTKAKDGSIIVKGDTESF